MVFQPPFELKFENGETSYAGIKQINSPGWEGWKRTEKGEKPSAVEIENYYYLDVWLPLWCHKIDYQSVAWQIFDHAVTTDIKTAIDLAQTVATTKITGVMSPDSLDAINLTDEFQFCDRYALARIKKYLGESNNLEFLKNRISRSLLGALVDDPLT